jgi:phage-related protein
MSTFTWKPSFSFGVSEEPKVLRNQMGDGYEQLIADGINNNPKIWELQFNNRVTSARGAVEAFDWTDPDGDTLRYICRSWPRNFYGMMYQSFNLRFEQVFGL